MGHLADDDEQSDQQLRSEPAVGLPARVLAAAAEGSQDRRRAAAVHHREAKPGELRAPLPRVGRADGRGGQAGVLDAEGDDGERHRAAAVARARAGARAPEQDSRRCRPDPAARSRAGGGRGRAAAREPDSRQHDGRRTRRIACAGSSWIRPTRRSGGCASIRSRSRSAALPLPDVDAAVANALDERYDLARAGHELENAKTNVEFLSNQKLPDVRLETSYRGSGLGGTQFLRTGGFPGVVDRHAQPELRRRARPGVHARLPDVELRRHRELSARPQLRRGEPRARRGRAPAGGAADREPAAAGRRDDSAGRRARFGAPPSASTPRAPARRWRSSASTPSSAASRSGCRRRFSSRRRSATCCRRR